jgi:hypothetical protein
MWATPGQPALAAQLTGALDVIRLQPCTCTVTLKGRHSAHCSQRTTAHPEGSRSFYKIVVCKEKFACKRHLAMELCEEVKSGIKLLSTASPSSVSAFFDQIALRVMDQCPADDIEAAFSSLSIALGSKGLVTSSVSTAILEGARQSVGEAEFCSVLESCGLKKDSSKEAARVFSGKLSALRVILMRTGSSLPRVQDVSWRLDYTVASKVAGKGGYSRLLTHSYRKYVDSNIHFRIRPVLFTSF